MKKIIIALSVIFGGLYSLSAQSTDFLLLEVLKARTFAEHWDTIPGTDNDKQFAMFKPGEWIRIADLVEIKWQKSSWGFWVPNKFSSEHWIKYDATSKQFLPKKSEQKFFGLAKCERVLVFTAIIIFIFAIIIFIFAVFYMMLNMLDCVNYHKWKEKRAERKEAKRKAKAEQKEEMAKRHSGCGSEKDLGFQKGHIKANLGFREWLFSFFEKSFLLCIYIEILIVTKMCRTIIVALFTCPNSTKLDS